MDHFRFRFALPVALSFLTVLVFLPVGRFPFVNLDDAIYVTANRHVQAGLSWESMAWAFAHLHIGYWQPLTWLSHMLDVQLFGISPGPHHFVNLLLHVLSVFLLFKVLHRMTGAPWASAAVAAFFAIHPLRVESVAWIAERKDVLSTTLWMLSMLAYASYAARRSVARYLVVLVLFGLGLMAKPMLVTLPCALLLLDIWPLERVVRSDLRVSLADSEPRSSWLGKAGTRFQTATFGTLCLEKIPMLVLAVVVGLVTWKGQHGIHEMLSASVSPLWVRVGHAAIACATYVRTLFWPTRLAVVYPYPYHLATGAAVASMSFLVVVTALVLYLRHRPYLMVGWFWYLGTVVLTTGLIPFGSTTMGDRFTYIPSIGLLIMVVWGVRDLVLGRLGAMRCAAVTAGVLLAASSWLTRLQLHYWRSDIALFEHAIAVTDGNWLAHNNLGAALKAAGRNDEARHHYREAIRISPFYADPHNNLGVLMAEEGQLDEAIEAYRAALRYRPDLVDAHNNLGAALSSQGDQEEAAAHYREALKYDPERVEVLSNYGALLAREGKTGEAEAQYTHALDLAPDFADAHHNLAVLLYKTGRSDEAVVHYRSALASKEDFAEARFGLGIALHEQGDDRGALEQYAALVQEHAALAETLKARINKLRD